MAAIRCVQIDENRLISGLQDDVVVAQQQTTMHTAATTSGEAIGELGSSPSSPSSLLSLALPSPSSNLRTNLIAVNENSVAVELALTTPTTTTEKTATAVTTATAATSTTIPAILTQIYDGANSASQPLKSQPIEIPTTARSNTKSSSSTTVTLRSNKRKRRRGKAKRKSNANVKPYTRLNSSGQWKFQVPPPLRGLSIVPYNTNKFLMEDHMPEIAATMATRTRDSSFSVDSEENYFYSLPEDEEEFLTKEFSSVYEDARSERLENMSKGQLMQEYLQLEASYDQLSRRLALRNRDDECREVEQQLHCTDHQTQIHRLEERVKELNAENSDLRRQLEYHHPRHNSNLSVAQQNGMMSHSTEDSESDSTSSSSSSNSSLSVQSLNGIVQEGDAVAIVNHNNAAITERHNHNNQLHLHHHHHHHHLTINGFANDGDGDADDDIMHVADDAEPEVNHNPICDEFGEPAAYNPNHI